MVAHKIEIDEKIILGNSNDNFFTTFNLSPLPMSIISIKDDKFIETNEVFLKATGLTKEQVTNMNAADPCFWLRKSDFVHIKRLISTQKCIRNHEVNIKIKSAIKTLLLSAAIIRWNGEPCVLLLANDVTESKLYKSELSRFDGLNLVAEMAAEIAHEIRNPITTVSGFLQMMRRNEKYVDDFNNLDLMLAEIDRANGIITEFLSQSRNRIVKLEKGDLNRRLKVLYPLMQAKATKKGIRINMDLHNISDIMIDEAELRQLVLNLVINGIDAMSEGGILSIRTFEDRFGVSLIIEDQGTGITADITEKVGTPFFTTKEKGTGLGLAVCNRIADRHYARIKFDTGANGTTFMVIFPYPSGSFVGKT